MVLIFVTLIVYGDKTFNDVPQGLKSAVKERLLVMGLDENGAPIENV